MLAVLVESSIRATLLIAAVALVLRAMRIQTASVRHTVWAGVVVTMLVLPATVAWGPKAALRLLPAEPQAVATPSVPRPVTISPGEPTAQIAIAPVAEQRSSWTWESYVAGLYFAGLALFLLRLGIGTVRVQWLMRRAQMSGGQRMHASCASPITVGCFRSMVILPPHWPQWPQAQLDAVLAHEQAHVSRRDPLFQYLGLLNRAVFWFHPLAWWLDRQLSGLAEEACDDIVLSQGYDPQEYSQYLVSIARSLQGDGTRVEMVGMAMPGAALPQRVRRMLTRVVPARTSRLRRLATWSLCVGSAGMLSTGVVVRAQRPLRPVEARATAIVVAPLAAAKLPVSIPLPRAVMPPKAETVAPLMAQAAQPTANPPSAITQSAPAQPARVQFEVATLKQRPLQVGGFVGGASPRLQGNRLTAQNLTLKTLIARAYEMGESRISGPDWMGQERYDISANVPEGTTLHDAMLMLRSLLEDRLKLTLHREASEQSVYALVVGKDGPKVHPIAEGEAFKAVFPKDETGARFFEVRGPMERWADALSPLAGRTVVDQTGLAGTYDYMLIMSNGRDEASKWPDLFIALQEQMGLKLEARKMMLEALVVDGAEKVPTGN